MLPWRGGGGQVGSVCGVSSCGRLQFASVRRENQIKGGQLEHALHPGHRQTAEADLRGLRNKKKEKNCCQTSIEMLRCKNNTAQLWLDSLS